MRDGLLLLGLYLLYGLLVTAAVLGLNSSDEGPRYPRWLIPVGVALWPLVAFGALVAVCWGLVGEER